MQKSWWVYGLIALGLLCAYSLMRAHTFDSEIVHDDGLFLYTGQAWAHGEVAYQDFWDHKPPGLFFFLSIPLRLFPFSLFAVKAFCVLWMALTATILVVWLWRRFGAVPAWIATTSFVFFTSIPYTIRSGGLTEEPGLLFVLLGLIAFSWRSDSVPTWAKWLLAGIAYGCAIQFRQTFVFSAWIAYVWILQAMWTREMSLREGITNGILFSVGMVVPEAFWQLYFVIRGAWWDYIEGSYLFNFAYVGSGGLERNWSDEFTLYQKIYARCGPLLLGGSLAMCTYYWLDPEKKRWLLPLVAAWIGEWIAIGLSGEYYSHYFVQVGITSAVLFALGVDGAIWGITQAINTRAITTGISVGIPTLIFTALTVHTSVLGVQGYLRDLGGIASSREQENSIYSLQRDVAEFTAALTEPDDRILLIGREPNSVYFLAGRYAGSRFYHFAPLWKDKLLGAVNEQHREAFVNDLEERRPALLLLDLTQLDTADAMDRVRDYTPEALAWIEQNTVPLEDVVGEDIYALWWYDIRLVIRVHRDAVYQVKERFAEIVL